jgi:hypothetical protein
MVPASVAKAAATDQEELSDLSIVTDGYVSDVDVPD